MAYTRTLEELLAGMQQRDRQALAELYGRFAPSLMGMLLRSLGDRSAAEAVIAEVFIDLWKRTRHTDGIDGSVAAQLVMVARAAAIRRLRAGRGFAPSEISESADLRRFLPWLPEPGAIASLAGRREVMSRVMKELPQRQRETLDLAVFKGYTETEIARKLGEPLGRVKSELRAGMRFLRHRLRVVLGTWSATI
jgi:RNA polymerase sigma-70 factor (ECF subfamily)